MSQPQVATQTIQHFDPDEEKGHFEIINKLKLSEMKVGDRVEQSDFSQMCPDNTFVQMKYHSVERDNLYDVKPGVWTIRHNNAGFFLEETSFVNDKILDEFISTKAITDKIDRFFNKLHVYADHGIEIPKRGILLYGPPGTGKTTSISKAAHKYGVDGKTAIVIWATDKYESYQIKEFMKNFRYVGVERVILLVEDIGGVEIDEVRMKSDSSLLALLDNQEKIFKTPVLIIATTNFPQIFMGNLTNRPGRFDDKIEVPYPTGEQRVALFKFVGKGEITEEALKLMGSDKTKEFSAAHIREVSLRSALDDISLEAAINQICDEIKMYKDNFEKKGKGISFDD